MFRKVLTAIDINDPKGAERAIAAARLLTVAEGAELHVVNVVPGAGMAMVGSYLGPEHAQKMLEEARGALQAWLDEKTPDGPQAVPHVVQGTIYDMIIKTANQIGADVIVVGSHRPELKDYLVGPNAARVVRHAKQSVFVVR